MSFSAQHLKAARLHLQKSDPVMKKLLKRVGPCTLKVNRDRFGALVKAILGQQISTAAARTILGRLTDSLTPEKLSAERLSQIAVEEYRKLGISRQKATYLLDLCENVNSQQLEIKKLSRMSDQDVTAALTQVKGIGNWTAQMFLIFSLGRLDVLPVDDLGIQKGIASAYELEGLPDAREIEAIAEPWRPYASIASWYLWRGLE
jgi:DNA-3-methyladenine glycosylase II